MRLGLAVHLFPCAASLENHAEPEVCRVALKKLVLRLKALLEGVVLGRTAAKDCAALPEPLESAAVARAASGLASIGALTARRYFTSTYRICCLEWQNSFPLIPT